MNVQKLRFTKTSGLLVAAAALVIVIAGYAFAQAQNNPNKPILIQADRLFDGKEMKTDMAVLIEDGKVKQVGKPEDLKRSGQKQIDLGDATIMPGFIEMHAHALFQNVPQEILLKNGLTTVRDVGGPLKAPSGGNGSLRLLTAGPILTAPGGYPIPGYGEKDIARTVASEDEARKAVKELVDGGANVIKIALEPGGEHGAPWSHSHAQAEKKANTIAQGDTQITLSGSNIAPPIAVLAHAGHGHGGTGTEHMSMPGEWPMLPEATVKVIVDEAHKHSRKVTAHVAEEKGVTIALNAGVDEWAHVPCMEISHDLLKRAVDQKVKVVTTIDTLVSCPGVKQNAKVLGDLGATFLYGAEVAHNDIPWGIDAQEMHYMADAAGMDVLDVFRAATSKAGEQLGIDKLGVLAPGAPADVIAVKGDPTKKFKLLENPGLVLSGGKIVVDQFSE